MEFRCTVQNAGERNVLANTHAPLFWCAWKHGRETADEPRVRTHSPAWGLPVGREFVVLFATQRSPWSKQVLHGWQPVGTPDEPVVTTADADRLRIELHVRCVTTAEGGTVQVPLVVTLGARPDGTWEVLPPG